MKTSQKYRTKTSAPLGSAVAVDGKTGGETADALADAVGELFVVGGALVGGLDPPLPKHPDSKAAATSAAKAARIPVIPVMGDHLSAS